MASLENNLFLIIPVMEVLSIQSVPTFWDGSLSNSPAVL
jgi:hypothetical protein